jgi:hypothetical protein
MYAIQPWDMYMYLIDVVHLDILLLKAYYTINYKNVDIHFSVHDEFLESHVSFHLVLKVKRLESQII